MPEAQRRSVACQDSSNPVAHFWPVWSLSFRRRLPTEASVLPVNLPASAVVSVRTSSSSAGVHALAPFLPPTNPCRCHAALIRRHASADITEPFLDLFRSATSGRGLLQRSVTGRHSLSVGGSRLRLGAGVELNSDPDLSRVRGSFLEVAKLALKADVWQ